MLFGKQVKGIMRLGDTVSESGRPVAPHEIMIKKKNHDKITEKKSWILVSTDPYRSS